MQPRKFSPHEIMVLQNQRNPKYLFSEDELKALSEGNGSLKMISRAEKIIDEHNRWLNLPPSRNEAFRMFLMINAFKQIHGKLHDQVLILTETLIREGIITRDEITDTGNAIVAEQAKEAKEAIEENERQDVEKDTADADKRL